MRQFAHELKSIRDIERALGRLSQASGNARDLVALKVSLQQIPDLKGELEKLIERASFGKTASSLLRQAAARASTPYHYNCKATIHEMPELAEKLGKALVDDPPLASEGRRNFSRRLRCRSRRAAASVARGQELDRQLQEREIAATGIKSLKVRFNSVFGYFIEITKSNLASVPAHYTRKQTTVGGERFITPELKEMEAKILGADERGAALEYQLFQKLRDETLRELEPIQQTAAADRDSRCDLRARGNRAALPLLPAAAERYAAAG